MGSHTTHRSHHTGHKQRVAKMVRFQILLLLLPPCLTLRCYSGLDTNYEEVECQTQCQGTPCLCIKADPVSATWTDPTLPSPGQYPNQGQYPGQGTLYPGQGNQGLQYPGQGVQYEGVDGQQHTYYPVSSRGGERVEARLPTYSKQWEASQRRNPRIVNQATTTLRQCWPNPFSAEREGCSLQYYHSALYNICRCSGDLCNGSPSHQPHLLAILVHLGICLAFL